MLDAVYAATEQYFVPHRLPHMRGELVTGRCLFTGDSFLEPRKKHLRELLVELTELLYPRWVRLSRVKLFILR